MTVDHKGQCLIWSGLVSVVLKEDPASEALVSAPVYGGPFELFAHIISSFFVKNLLSTHKMYSQLDHKEVLCSQRDPNSNCNVQVAYTAFKWAPNRNAMCKYSVSKGPQQQLQCVDRHFAFKAAGA